MPLKPSEQRSTLLAEAALSPSARTASQQFQKWRMFAQVIAPDGESMVQIDTEAADSTSAETFGRWVAEDLKSKGALELLAV